jgi:hypothetical protein
MKWLKITRRLGHRRGRSKSDRRHTFGYSHSDIAPILDVDPVNQKEELD